MKKIYTLFVALFFVIIVSAQPCPDSLYLTSQAQVDSFQILYPICTEIDGDVVGFIIGDANGWEYGAPENVGWIDTIGVDPDFQRTGIAKILFTEMINNLKKVGVEAIYTFVAWRDWTLLTFFDEMGFEKGDMINLELKI